MNQTPPSSPNAATVSSPQCEAVESPTVETISSPRPEFPPSSLQPDDYVVASTR